MQICKVYSEIKYDVEIPGFCWRLYSQNVKAFYANSTLMNTFEVSDVSIIDSYVGEHLPEDISNKWDAIITNNTKEVLICHI